MLYRHMLDGRRKPVDLEGFYQGSLFLCGGHPSLKNEDLSLFHQHGITTMAMNNTASMFRPSLWVCADRPTCYSLSILKDPSIVKFGRLSYQAERHPEDPARWRDMPSTFFYGTSEYEFSFTNLLCQRPLFAFWKNVFVIALQLSYYLGFRHLFLCGVGFSISKGAKYAYDSAITDAQVASNQRCYNTVLDQVLTALPHFNDYGLRLTSCTPGSPLNEHIGFTSLRDAIESVKIVHPQHDTINVKHSSEASPKPRSVDTR